MVKIICMLCGKTLGFYTELIEMVGPCCAKEDKTDPPTPSNDTCGKDSCDFCKRTTPGDKGHHICSDCTQDYLDLVDRNRKDTPLDTCGKDLGEYSVLELVREMLSRPIEEMKESGLEVSNVDEQGCVPLEALQEALKGHVIIWKEHMIKKKDTPLEEAVYKDMAGTKE
ncbi:MAG: hypothetical protein JRI65_14800 [Deltaproteobacteria bacterium]|nr:hypothetical protein [Deltaproteobacteria bacterium]